MLDDFVGESPTAGFFGTGPITLAGATSPFTTRFRDARHGATGSKWLLCARTTSAQPAANGTKYMIFEGTFTYGSPDQVSVDRVYQSSAGYGVAVTWVASDVFVVFAAPSLEALSGVLQYDVDRGTSTPTLGLSDSGSVNHFDVTAANRTLNLPAGSTVNRFYRVGVTGYGSSENYISVTPNGADTIAGVTGASKVYGNTGTRDFRWSVTMGKWIPEANSGGNGSGRQVLSDTPTITSPILSSTTWAGKPAAGSAGKLAFISNAGTKGSIWLDDGTRWKPMNGLVVLATLDSASSAIGNTETVAFQYQIPTGLWQTGDTLRIEAALEKSGTTDTGAVTIRIGTAGTTSDTAVMGPSNWLSASNRSTLYTWDTRLEAATTTQATSVNTGYGPSTATFTLPLTISSAAANSLFVNVCIKGGATDTVVLKTARLILIGKAN